MQQAAHAIDSESCGYDDETIVVMPCLTRSQTRPRVESERNFEIQTTLFPDANAAAPPKRGRGRPKKNSRLESHHQTPVAKRRPGRPRKHPRHEFPVAKILKFPLEEGYRIQKRPVGRPRKRARSEQQVFQYTAPLAPSQPVSQKRGPGRPRKHQRPESSMVKIPGSPLQDKSSVQKRGRGRPRKHLCFTFCEAGVGLPSRPAKFVSAPVALAPEYVRRSTRLAQQEPLKRGSEKCDGQMVELMDISIDEASRVVGVTRPVFETAEDFIWAHERMSFKYRQLINNAWCEGCTIGEIQQEAWEMGYSCEETEMERIFFHLKFSGLWWADLITWEVRN